MNHTQFSKKKIQNNNRSSYGYGRKKTTYRSGAKRKGTNGVRIHPDLFVKKAINPEENNYIAERTIHQMPVHERLKGILNQKGFVYPTEIQDKTLEKLIEGNDLLGIAQTGTGKTGAYLIPLIHQMMSNRHSLKVLVIVPTRELAVQVEHEFTTMTRGFGFSSSCFIGGTSINNDLHKLRRENHLVVGTPGRLLDLENRRVLNLKSFTVLVLDEFDRMLDMGFIDDIKQMVHAMQNRKQTLMFSATLDESQRSLINTFLNDPVEIKVSSGQSACDNIEQDVIYVDKDGNKFQVLLNMLEKDDFEKVLVFAETKRSVDHLYVKLKKSGIMVDQIHGDKSQRYRQHALDQFKFGRIQVLVATDVAARGLDVTDITHVINFHPPKNFDSYIHRIGRTGRAGKVGKAFTFID
jgi:ATP-dependent RNA helicase RhlE